jgi:diketogulonate reductase-like aldo/keto reductase
MQTAREHPAHISHKWGIDFALNTGTNVPAIGFGTWRLPKDRTQEILHMAIDAGYRHFDCSPNYGNQNEIGVVLHEVMCRDKITRGELFITSKLWNTDHRRHNVYEELDQTVRQLRLHHLDLWLMHWPLSFRHGGDEVPKNIQGKVMLEEVPIAETWKAMEEMYKNGKCRAIGVCNFTLPMLQNLESVAEITPAVLQIELHPYLQQPDLIRYCQERGIHVTAFSPLGANDIEPEPNLLTDPVILDIAHKHNKTAAQVCLRWSVQRHISVVVRSTREEHIRENLRIFDFELDDDDIRRISLLDRGHRFISPAKMWGIPLFPEEQGQVEMEQAVGEMYARVESAK